MLFANKNKTAVKENWAIVLNPIRSELAKSRMIERMTQVFPLAVDEASDLVDNTPIILLEGLGQEAGEQLREFFTQTGAELLLTDDPVFRRKCFRAVWPHQPNLQFLSQASREPVLAESHEHQEVRGYAQSELTGTKTEFREPAVDQPEEIWRPEKFDRLREVESSTETAIQEERAARLLNEQEKLQTIILQLQRENDQLKTGQINQIQLNKDFEALRSELSALQRDRVSLVEASRNFSAENEKLKAQLKQVEAERAALLEQKEKEIRTALDQSAGLESTVRQKYEAQISELRLGFDRERRDGTRQIEELRAKHAAELEKLNARAQELQNQLDAAQRQIREFNTFSEQQELMEKRNRIALQIAEKESKLREALIRQELLEKELQDSRTTLETVRAERETLESDIVKDKQAQKYLFEQLKMKEKSKSTDRPGQTARRPANGSSSRPAA